MKKKLIFVVAVVALVAICAVAMVACTPNNVESYVKALAKANKGTIAVASGGVTYAFDGDNLHIKIDAMGASSEVYVIATGDKKIMYTAVNKTWTKIEAPEEISEMLKDYDVKKIFSAISVDKADYNIKDGVWTDKKTGLTTLSIEDGKLVAKSLKLVVFTFNSAKPNITLPAEAKALK